MLAKPIYISAIHGVRNLFPPRHAAVPSAAFIFYKPIRFCFSNAILLMLIAALTSRS